MIRLSSPRASLSVGLLLAGSLLAVAAFGTGPSKTQAPLHPVPRIDPTPAQQQSARVESPTTAALEPTRQSAPAAEKPGASPKLRETWAREAKAIQTELLTALVAGQPGAVEAARKRATILARKTAGNPAHGLDGRATASPIHPSRAK